MTVQRIHIGMYIDITNQNMRKNFFHQINFLFIILIFTTLSSCSDSKDKNVVRTYWENGNLKSELRYKDDKLNGECFWYYYNGKPEMKTTYLMDELNGETVRWYENGNIQSRYYVVNDQYEGVFESYNVYGALVKREHYKKGVLHGSLTQWYDSGKVFLEGGYNEGMFHGKWMMYYEDGAVGSVSDFDNGSGVQKGFAADGETLIALINYRDNVKDGEEIRYNTDGSVKEVLIWNEGEFVEKQLEK